MKHLGKGNLPIGETITETLTGRWLPASAGIDVHKHVLLATVLIPDFNKQTIERYTQKFNTDYLNLIELKNWLLQFKPYGLTCYGIEATSTYYRPIEYALTGYFDQILINPYLLKERRKTDAKDSTTIAYVVLTGLFQARPITPEIRQQLKTLTRRQRKAIYKRTATSNAIETTLTNYNILLGQEISMLSASGKAIIEVIIGGATIPEVAAMVATHYSQSNLPERKEKHQRIINSLRHLPLLPSPVRFTIGQLYDNVNHFDNQIEAYQARINQLIGEYSVINPETGEIIITASDAIILLKTLPSVNDRFIQTFIAECGIDMSAYPTDTHLVSYCGFNPEKRVSSDRVVSAGTMPGNKHMHSIATQIAQSIMQHAKENNPLAMWGKRYRSRNGGTSGAHNMAVSAVARRLIIAIWHMLSKQEPYQDEQYNYTAHLENAGKQVNKLLRQTREITTTLHGVDITPQTKATALNIMSTIANAIGMETAHYQIVPHQTDKPITDLELPKRIITVLNNHDITTASQLVYLWASQSLHNLSGVGQTTYTTILDCLTNHNYIKPANGTPESPQPTASQPSP